MTKLTEEEKKSVRRFNKKFQILLLVLFGAISYFLGVSANSSYEWFVQNGVRTTAEVVDAYSKFRQTTYIVQFDVNGDTVIAEIQSDLKVGQTVEILYNPNDPTDIRVANISKTGYIFYIASTIFWLFAMVGVIDLSYSPPSK